MLIRVVIHVNHHRRGRSAAGAPGKRPRTLEEGFRVGRREVSISGTETNPLVVPPCAGSIASSLNACWSHVFVVAILRATRRMSIAARAVGRTYMHPTLIVNVCAYNPPPPHPMVLS